MKRSASILLFVSFAVFSLSESSIRNVSSTERTTEFTLENFDIRTDSGQPGNKRLSEHRQQTADSFLARYPDAKLEPHPALDTFEVISTAPGAGRYLTSPSSTDRVAILRQFVADHRDVFGLADDGMSGLQVTADYSNPNGALSFVHLEQTIAAVPVFQGEIKAAFTRRNEIVRIINGLTPVSETRQTFGKASDAVIHAARHLHVEMPSETLFGRIIAESPNRVTFERGPFEDEVVAERFYFPVSTTDLRAAWRVLIWTDAVGYYVVVDAGSGELLWRKRITEFQTQPATYNVYGGTGMMKSGDSPTPGTPGCSNPGTCVEPPIVARQSFTLIGNEAPYSFNNLGWITDGENRTFGNNAEVGIDRDGTQGIDPNGWATGVPARNFVYNYNPSPGSPPPGESPTPAPPQPYPPTAFQQGSVTNAFYVANRWHDELYRLGFTEQARNYQNDNFGRGGTGSDPVMVEVQEGIGTNGANFSTPADGGRPRAQMFVWTGTNPSRDGALDSQIVVHELTHGLSSRLVGNATGLTANMARSMGEGWSDFFALAMLSEPEDDPYGIYSISSYVAQGIIPGSNATQYYGIRRFPIARKASVGPNGLPHNPLTFRYLNSDCAGLIGTPSSNPPPNSAYPRGPFGTGNCDQVLNAGEIWASALWEVRGQLMDLHGAEEGNRRALQYAVDGMKLVPLNPTMLNGRDAYLAAAQVTDAADVCFVWRGFAMRGLGFSASIQNAGSGTNNTSVTEAFNVPAQCLIPPVADFDGDGKSDVSVFRPSEGNWYLNRSATGFTAVNWGIASDIIAAANYDGDDKTDVAVYRLNDSGQPDLYVLNSSDGTVSYRFWGSAGDVPVTGDFDGDGKDDSAIFRPSTGVFWVTQSSGGGVLTSRPFPAGRPISGDFDGDGRADMGTMSNGQWHISSSTRDHSSGVIHNWGLAGDVPVHSDYDGDGRLDLAVYRPSNGNWYIQKSSGGIAIYHFGLATDVPVPGDYDGDGIADIAVYRDGLWYINRSTSGLAVVWFGLASDRPVPAGMTP